jgi:hypothetical protein
LSRGFFVMVFLMLFFACNKSYNWFLPLFNTLVNS